MELSASRSASDWRDHARHRPTEDSRPARCTRTVVVATSELEALLPVRLGDVKQPANPETHLGALALHPVEQLLDVDPRPVKLQGSPLRSSDDSNQPSFVVMFVFGAWLIGRMKSGP